MLAPAAATQFGGNTEKLEELSFTKMERELIP